MKGNTTIFEGLRNVNNRECADAHSHVYVCAYVRTHTPELETGRQGKVHNTKCHWKVLEGRVVAHQATRSRGTF